MLHWITDAKNGKMVLDAEVKNYAQWAMGMNNQTTMTGLYCVESRPAEDGRLSSCAAAAPPLRGCWSCSHSSCRHHCFRTVKMTRSLARRPAADTRIIAVVLALLAVTVAAIFDLQAFV